MTLKRNPKILAASLEDSYFGHCCITSMKMRFGNTAPWIVDPSEAGSIPEHQAHGPTCPVAGRNRGEKLFLKGVTVLLNFGIRAQGLAHWLDRKGFSNYAADVYAAVVSRK